MVIQRWTLILLSAAMIATLAGCGGGSTFNVQNPPPPPSSNVSIAFDPAPTGSVPVNGTVTVTAKVTNDPSDAGVSWTLTCGSPGNCGTLSSPHTASDSPTTYTPPAVLSANNLSVTIVALATADQNQNVAATINVSAFGSALSGTYVIEAHGVTAGFYPYQFVGEITLDGQGNITFIDQTINFFDANLNGGAGGFVSKRDTASSSTSPVGSYFVGGDGRGTITLKTADIDIGGNGVETFSFIILSSSRLLVSQSDFAFAGTPPDQVPNTAASASGTMDLQASTSTVLSGSYAFVMNGYDYSGAAPTAYGGVFNVDTPGPSDPNTPGAISGDRSLSDLNFYGTAYTNQQLSGTITTTASDQAIGVVTLALNAFAPAAATSVQLTGYIVDSNHIKLIESDDSTGFGFALTDGVAISQGTANLTTFSGTYVFSIIGSDLAIATSASYMAGGIFDATTTGTLSGFSDTFFQGAGTQLRGVMNGNYFLGNRGVGRTSATVGIPGGLPYGGRLVFYQTIDGTLLILNLGDNTGDYLTVGTGIAYPQGSTLAFGGDYGIAFTQNNGTEVDGTGWLNASSGTFSGAADDASAPASDSLAQNHSFSGTYNPPPCFVSSVSNLPQDCFSADFTTPGNPFNNAAFVADFYMIDATQGIFVESDFADPIAPTGQITLGYYASRCQLGVNCQSLANHRGSGVHASKRKLQQ